ncbi:MAG: holo-ACP synthase [Deltaproteobacteria bacterium]|nr:holo-ACP synthase [Deltaproteobacteria bacterium]
MILGIGTDLVSLKRIENVLHSHPQRFIEKICHPDEIAYLSGCHCETALQPWQSKKIRTVASCFAIKEALAKACGTGFSQGLWFSQICVSRLASGAPTLATSGLFENYLNSLKVASIHVSVSYEKDFCQAIVILEK